MNQKLAVVTGFTSGIGLAVARALSKEGYAIYGICRSSKKAGDIDFPLFKIEVHDFKDETNYRHFLEPLNVEPYNEVVLINNAGTLDPIQKVMDLRYDALWEAFNVNMMAPVFLCQKFYQKLSDSYEGTRTGRIINISTGAAFHGYAGWTAYCSTKAAFWLFTQCFSLEMDTAICKIMALAPGVVETNMQHHIREQSVEVFPEVEKFRDMKDQNVLYSPEIPAKYIVDLLKRSEFPHGLHEDLREHQK